MATHSQHLRQRFLLTGSAVTLLLVTALAWFTAAEARRSMVRQANERGEVMATRIAAIVSNFLDERRREAVALANLPSVIAAAREAAADVTGRGLDGYDAASLERLFATTRQLGGDPALRDYLRAYSQISGITEVLFTERHGYTVLASDRPAHFVQADQPWWQPVMAKGTYEGEATYDSTAAAVSIEFDFAITPPRASRPIGALKVVFGLDRLAYLLGTSDLGTGAYVQVVDESGRLLVAPDARNLLQPFPQRADIARGPKPTPTVVTTAAGDELVVSAPSNQRKWWVLFRQPTGKAYAAARSTVRSVLLASLALALFVMALIYGFWRRFDRLITEPVKAAAGVAGRVAGGDLSATVSAFGAQAAEVSDLLSSVHSMVLALRRLVGAIRTAADEAAAMATEISASSEEMSASAQEMSGTAQELTRRATDQAQLIRGAADDAAKILQIATVLAAGAEDAVRRNTAVAELARRHKDVLDESTAQLGKLTEEINRGAREADALAKAAAEIQKFVARAKAVATQTNMLALNAGIEAARAGPEGRGFAVVADEVRKLASVAAAAAGETADTVRGVLARVEATRERLAQLARGGAAAREAAQTAAQGLATVAAEAQASDVWSREIAKMAGEMRALIEEISARLGSVAQGTESLLASAEEIAASSEEQSASTEEIASSANQLAEASDRLTSAVKSFRLLAQEEPPAHQAAD
jgi:methyl-accepting chemotaxis protein